MKNNVFLILGGDNRSLYVGEYLEKQHFNVCYYAFNDTDCFDSLHQAIDEASVIILPLPASRDRVSLNAPLFDETVLLTDICTLVTPDKFILGGQLPKSFCEALVAKSVDYCDYFLLEELAIYNAVPTAEGVLNILIEKTPITIHGMKCAITGYGKVGKALSNTMKALGADVTVFARKESAIAEARAVGLKADYLTSLTTDYHSFDTLINTIPTKVIGGKEMDMLNPECLLVETASSPFGIDFQEAKEHAMEAIKASSLPGKVAPKTAGEIIGLSVLPIIKQRGVTE